MSIDLRPRTVRLRQDSDAWETWRRRHIGGSDAPVIAGESPWSSPLDLWLAKVEGKTDASPDTQRLWRIGKALEPVVLALYEEETGRKVRRGRVLESREIPWLSASLDGEAGDRIVEAKWTSSSRWSDGVPGDVLVQVTHQLAVAGKPVADVAVLTPRGFSVHEVAFDERFWGAILALEEEFWGRVERREPPPPDASEASRRAMARLWPDDSGTILDADPAAVQIVTDLLAARARAKELEATIASLENALCWLLADASGMRGPGFSVSYRRTKDIARTDWPAYAAALEALLSEAAIPLPAKEGFTSVQPGSRRLIVREGGKE